jgi:hypothetical protein
VQQAGFRSRQDGREEGSKNVDSRSTLLVAAEDEVVVVVVQEVSMWWWP